MNALVHTVTLWSSTAAGALLSATWQGFALTASIGLSLRLLPRLTAAARSALWLGVFLIVVLLHFAPLVVHSAPPLPDRAIIRIHPGWALAVTFVWSILSLYRAARMVGSALRLRQIARRARPTLCNAASVTLLRSARRAVTVCTSLDVDRPSVLGFRSPLILLPPALLAKLSADELNQMLLHELEHLRRGDDWTNLLQKLALVVFPLNPVLLWIERCLCAERERACDDGVLRRTQARKAYAGCLARLAEHSIVERGTSLALSAWQRRSELSQRVYRILFEREPALGGRQAGLLTGALAVALMAGAGELAHSPQLVRFAPAPAAFGSAGVVTTGASQPDSYSVPPAPHLSMVNAVMRMPDAGDRSGNGLMVRPRLRSAAMMQAGNGSHHVQAKQGTGTLAVKRAIAIHPAPPARSLSASSWVVLTNWQPSAAPSRLTLAVDTDGEDILPRYAAMPVANGWLIIEL